MNYWNYPEAAFQLFKKLHTNTFFVEENEIENKIENKIENEIKINI